MTHTARVALLQLRAYDLEDAEASLQHTLARIDEAAKLRPDIIALPEVSYPAYFFGRTDLDVPGVRPPAEVEALFAAKAREHGVYIAAAMATDAPAGSGARYCNGAVLFGRDGATLGRYAKSFLWHFDQRWFAPGGAYPVFETDFGRIGILICADGRMPEIVRSLVVGGAQLILDLTAWVSGARHPADLTSAQRTYLMPARAAENGVWVAAAAKAGVEAESIVYCGGSCVIDPRGRYVAQLGPEEDAILTRDIAIEDAAAPVTRRPELYDALTLPTESLPVEQMRDEPLIVEACDRNISVVQMTMPADGAQFIVAARRHVERLALQDADLVLFPATPSRFRAAYMHDGVLAGMRQIAAETGVLVAFSIPEPKSGGPPVMYLVGPEGVVAEHRLTHKPAKITTMPLAGEPCPVVETPLGRIGLMLAAEGYAPEVARSLMLRGTEILLWAADDPPLAMTPIVRTRADENRVYVATAAAPTATGATMIVAPSGAVIAEALEGRELAVSATVNRALARLKERAPGTDIVRARQPESYGILARAQTAAAGRVV